MKCGLRMATPQVHMIADDDLMRQLDLGRDAGKLVARRRRCCTSLQVAGGRAAAEAFVERPSGGARGRCRQGKQRRSARDVRLSLSASGMRRDPEDGRVIVGDETTLWPMAAS
jgi:hypothetical protein